MLFRSKMREIDLPELGAMLRLSDNFRRLEVFRKVEGEEPELLRKMSRWEFFGRDVPFVLDDDRVLLVRGVRGEPGHPVDEWARVEVGLEGEESRIRLVQRCDPAWYLWAPAIFCYWPMVYGPFPWMTGLWMLLLWISGVSMGLWLLARWFPATFKLPIFRGWWILTPWLSTFLLGAAAPAAYRGLFHSEPTGRSALYFFPLWLCYLFLLVSWISVLERGPAAVARYHGWPQPPDGLLGRASLLRMLGSRLGLEDRRLSMPERGLIFCWSPGFRQISIENEGVATSVLGVDTGAVPVELHDGTALTVGPMHGWPIPDRLDVRFDGEKRLFQAVDKSAQQMSGAFGLAIGSVALAGLVWGLWSFGNPEWLLGFSAVSAVLMAICAALVVLGVRSGLFETLGYWLGLFACGPCVLLPIFAFVGFLIGSADELLGVLSRVFGVFLLVAALGAAGLWGYFVGNLRLWKETYQSAGLGPTWAKHEDY